MKLLHWTKTNLFCAVAFITFASGLSAQAVQIGIATPTTTTVDPAVADPNLVAVRAGKYRDGSYAGTAFDAYYGLVQVQANVQSGKLVSIDVLNNPKHSGTSRSINRKALPILEQSVVRSQSTRVNLVSGATLTSRAYLRSLNSALKQAGG